MLIRSLFAVLGLALVAVPSAQAALGPAPVNLRTAGDFAVLAGSALTNTGRTTIVGDVGSSPTPTQTGYEPCPAANCVDLTGVNHNAPAPNDAVTQQAKADLQTAYDDAAGRTGGASVTVLGGGQTLVPGLYTSADDIFVGGDLTLDGGGDPDSVFIIQARTGTLVTAAGTSGGIPNTRVLLTNGAQGCNVFWQVGSSATISTATQFAGTILALQSITVNTNAALVAGRALARNGATTLDTNTVRRAACAAPGTTPPSSAGTGTGTGSGAGTGSGTNPNGGPAGGPAGGAPCPVGARGTSRLTGPRNPRGPFTVRVTGRSIREVAFFLDGRLVRTVRAAPGRTAFTARIIPGRDTRLHRVVARTTFRTNCGPSRVARLAFRRAGVARPPRFTG